MSGDSPPPVVRIGGPEMTSVERLIAKVRPVLATLEASGRPMVIIGGVTLIESALKAH